jgi:TP901-1 family phage major tail protein
MVAAAGRDLRIKYDDGTGAAVIAGARTDTLTINNEMIDVTNKDDSGIRTLLDDVGLKSISLSCEGVLKDDTLQDLARDAAASAALHDFEIQIAALGSYSGKFFIASFEATGASDGEMTFTCSLESAGAITFT